MTSSGKDPGTPPQDTGQPDQIERDPAALNSGEDLDEDRLRVDPLEEGVEPPERWTAADRFGTTPFEEHHGEALDERLAEEEPDVDAGPAPERPVSATPLHDLDETIDEEVPGTEQEPDESFEVGRRRAEPTQLPEAARRGQSAEEAGGSVADTMRTPEEPPE
ncbi:hypothetical protein [Gandjariella thermophila]|uniref:DUF5709 domain-containing protein n=1 Tax=Gandjariella thermophila TaxID=1931992 RepID=A0A4D4J9T9_9PSEU|nr:hypothetical protein [Gandjariella thermophila]GDY33585.1 hypothetical protein GTS_52180 [Gandjariella thermophila]